MATNGTTLLPITHRPRFSLIVVNHADLTIDRRSAAVRVGVCVCASVQVWTTRHLHISRMEPTILGAAWPWQQHMHGGADLCIHQSLFRKRHKP
jgi:hypothetical protein